MSEQSTRLGLPYLLTAQAQKHVAYNEALSRLDLLVHLTVQGFEVNDPPNVPQEGEIWVLGDVSSGVWHGQAGRLAVRESDGWGFIAPALGWLAVHVTAQEPDLRVLTATGWTAAHPDTLSNLTALGVNTAPDAVNRLAVASAADGTNWQDAVIAQGGTEQISLPNGVSISGAVDLPEASIPKFIRKIDKCLISFRSKGQKCYNTGAVSWVLAG